MRPTRREGRYPVTDPEARVMRNGEGGTVPSYNLQLLTDTTHGLVVNVETSTDAIDYRQIEPAIARCQKTLGRKLHQLVADGDYTNHASVQAAAVHGADFYCCWRDSWKPGERDAQGRDRAFQASAFPYDVERDFICCSAGATMRSAVPWRDLPKCFPHPGTGFAACRAIFIGACGALP